MKRRFAPDDDEKPFIARWNMLVRILLVESSVKHVARVAMDYADFRDGTSCHPSNELIARETGYDERTVRLAWSVMRGVGMAVRVSRGVAYQRLADEYELQIPETWKSLPILGPHGRRFTCLHCGTLFNPQGNCTVNSRREEDKQSGGDVIRFKVERLAFCAPPRRTKGRSDPDCAAMWSRAEVKAGRRPWHQLEQDVWKMFRLARGDDW